ncbi:lipoprotein-releasing system permease protein [Chitinivorax tropicus]|uniref:Lipoprotein-releasing system permease protein n=1 Tax=Chitinivorax tropicus TaxID=714531 RepID=A0A840MQU4_9PROT|nr:lipoprotein-releasing ABC transporter permease subunit [Chitinivorax tropicus]MBB5018816.1 lipoprotein-releasing system permease protein [Chitinivorax tropicus]
MTPFELFVGLRYTRAKRRNHFISFISGASMVGIALGVWALIVVLSVMNGFQKEVRARMLSVVSHVQVIGPKEHLAGWQSVTQQVRKNPHVVASAPYVSGQGLLSFDATVKGVAVQGIVPDAEATVSDVAKHMKQGKMDALVPGAFGMVLGRGVARELGVQIGDKVTLITPQGQVSPVGAMPRFKQFTVVGIFNMDLFQYDDTLAYIHMADAQKLFRFGEDVSGVRLKLDDVMQSPTVARTLIHTLKADAYVMDWTQQNANYFRAVQIEKRMMFIILTLIVAVAAFNLVSTLVMTVTDKQADIAILRTMGASPGSIMKIFIVQGSIVGFIGTIAGSLAGIVTALNIDVIVPTIERFIGTKILAGEVYFITELPSDLQWSDVSVITVVSLILSLLATLYPSWRAARINPAEALRYE